MATMYNISVTVISQKGTCLCNHKVGDQWIISSVTPAGICTGTIETIISAGQVLRYGGMYPWENGPKVKIACPDADNPVVFELKKLPEQDL